MRKRLLLGFYLCVHLYEFYLFYIEERCSLYRFISGVNTVSFSILFLIPLDWRQSSPEVEHPISGCFVLSESRSKASLDFILSRLTAVIETADTNVCVDY